MNADEPLMAGGPATLKDEKGREQVDTGIAVVRRVVARNGKGILFPKMNLTRRTVVAS
jgi:hypothetical protein